MSPLLVFLGRLSSSQSYHGSKDIISSPHRIQLNYFGVPANTHVTAPSFGRAVRHFDNELVASQWFSNVMGGEQQYWKI
jgi:hypothetical protein